MNELKKQIKQNTIKTKLPRFSQLPRVTLGLDTRQDLFCNAPELTRGIWSLTPYKCWHVGNKSAATMQHILTEVFTHAGWGSRLVSLRPNAWSSGNAPQQFIFSCISRRRLTACFQPVRNNAFCWLGPMARQAHATMNWMMKSRNSTTMYWAGLRKNNPQSFWTFRQQLKTAFRWF